MAVYPAPDVADLDWVLRPGSAPYGAVAVWRADGTASLVTREATVLAVDLGEERRTLSTGVLQTMERRAHVEVAFHNAADVRALEAWAADGADVCARLLSTRPAPHLFWDEPVPVHLDAYRGALAGRALTLHSEATGAAVYESPDLLAGLTFGPGGDWVGVGPYDPITWETDAAGEPVMVLDMSGGDAGGAYVDLVLPAGLLWVALSFVEGTRSGAGQAVVYPRIVAAPIGGTPTWPLGPDVDDAVYLANEVTTAQRGYRLPADTYHVRVGFELDNTGGAGDAFRRVRAPRLLTRWRSGEPIGATVPDA